MKMRNANLDLRNAEYMSNHISPERSSAGAVGLFPSCPQCIAYRFGICQSVTANIPGFPAEQAFEQSAHTTQARRIICRGQDMEYGVPFICSGWAVTAVRLSDGSRQILSFLLPGDIVSTALLFESKTELFVEAVTDVSYRTFSRIALKKLIFSNPESFAPIGKLWIEEKTRADELIVDLGRRTADERIARLILGLVDRLQQRGMVQGDQLEFEFPLRQHHIADATGLTPVHVSKVLSEFRRRKLIALNERSLAILDLDAFRRTADMR